MRILIIVTALVLLPGCAYFSDAIGLDYGTEAEYQKAVDQRISERNLDPAIAELVRENLYALWTKDRETVLDSYELDEAVKTLVINQLTK